MGYTIPAGSIVLGNHFAISRDESTFGNDTDKFIPERWLNEDGTLKNLPQTGFGFGRRICTGRNIARNVRLPSPCSVFLDPIFNHNVLTAST